MTGSLAVPSRRSIAALGRARSGAALFAAATLAVAGSLLVGGCKAAPKPAPAPDPDVQIPPGEHGLRKLSREEYPDVRGAFMAKDDAMFEALKQSGLWFATNTSKSAYSSQQLGPIAQVVADHRQAAASVFAFRVLLDTVKDADAFQEAVYAQFDIWQTRGSDGKGKVLFTGYFSPEIKASMQRTETFRFPLYQRPKDLVTDSQTGEPLGRQGADGTISPWPARKDILASGELAGTELVWLASAFDAYVCEVNGSAKLIMPDNSVKYVGYAGKTGRPYVGLGMSLVQDGVLTRRERTLGNIKRLYERDPGLVQRYIDRNENMVFFSMYDAKAWPLGSLGVPVTAYGSLATDKKIFPRGLAMLVDTQTADYAGTMRPFNRFMFDQDTGGAIRAAGRGDIYMGVGAAAEVLAGNQYAEGTFHYFVLKPEFVEKYSQAVATLGPKSSAVKIQARALKPEEMPKEVDMETLIQMQQEAAKSAGQKAPPPPAQSQQNPPR
jgi:membrane-bound lytic murein transglycosylase A